MVGSGVISQLDCIIPRFRARRRYRDAWLGARDHPAQSRCQGTIDSKMRVCSEAREPSRASRLTGARAAAVQARHLAARAGKT